MMGDKGKPLKKKAVVAKPSILGDQLVAPVVPDKKPKHKK